MRSRYSAYVYGLEDYLLNTWHPDTRPNALNLKEDTAIKWLRLEILRQASSQTDINHASHQATVEFVAYYKMNGKAEKVHEISHFEYLAQGWHYHSGEHTK